MRHEIFDTNQFTLSLLGNLLMDLKSPIVITDNNADILCVNKEFEKTTGYKSHEVIGRNPRILQTGMTRKKSYEQLWKDLEAGRCWRGEFFNKRKDGTIYSEAAVIAPLILENKKCFLGIKFDLSPIMNRKLELETILYESQKILDSLPILVSYMDKELRYMYVNEPYARGLGLQWTDVINKQVPEILPDSLKQKHLAWMYEALEGKTIEFESHGPSPDSPIKNIYGVYMPDFDKNGNLKGLVDFSFDITKLKEVEAEKNLAREQFEIIAEAVPGIIFQFKLGKNANWSFEYLKGDPEFINRLGLDIKTIIENSENAFSLVPIDERIKLNTALYKSAEEMSQFNWIANFRLPAGLLWLKITATPQRFPDESVCWTGLALEITDQKKIQFQMEQNNVDLKIKAETDFLTGLLNRRRFEIEVDKEIDRFNRYNTPFCYAILDLDKFKLINDKYGHDTGDEVLKDFAKHLLLSVRKLDTPARIGGEEFTLLFPETNLDMAVSICERFLKIIRSSPLSLPNQSIIKYTCSIGLVSYRKGEKVEQLCKRADDLLYKAKENGRDRLIAES